MEPSHEIVTVRGKGTPIGWLISRGVESERGSWSEVPDTRVDLWRSPEDERRVVEFRYGVDHWERGDLWLDVEGGLWRTGAREVELSIHDYNQEEERFILPKGTPFRSKRTSKDIGHRVVFRRVPGALPIVPLEPEGMTYVRAIVAALAHAERDRGS